MPTIFQLPLNLEPIFWWREIWGTSTCKGHLPKNKKKYINKSKTASFEILFQKVAPNSPCSLPSLSLWSCYITPPYPVSPYRPDPRCPRWQGSPALTGWYRCQEPSGQMAGAKGEQTTRVHFFSHLLVGWAARCGTNRISPSLPPFSLPHPLVCHVTTGWGLQIAGQDYLHLQSTPRNQMMTSHFSNKKG